MSKKLKIQALTTCHNRKIMTMKTISDLKSASIPKGVTLSITVVDDGSEDGTAEALRAKHPDVEVLRGSGSLFWAGGMRFGWDKALHNRSFDYLLVFNDDISLSKWALQEVLEPYDHHSDCIKNMLISVGAFKDPETGAVTYGGLKRSSKWHPLRFKKVKPNQNFTLVDSLNMNFALIPKTVIEKLGFFETYFIHGGADVEYGLRLRSKGGQVCLVKNYIGTCSQNTVISTSLEPGINYMQRWQRLLSVKEQPITQRFRYFRTYGGKFWFILFLLPYFRALAPLKRGS